MAVSKTINGVKVLTLAETHPEEAGVGSDQFAMFHLWTLITGGEMLRDLTVANRAMQ